MLTCKAVKHYKGRVYHTGFAIIRCSIFPLSILLELDLSCRMEGKHNLDLDSNFVALHSSPYCLVESRDLLLVGQNFSLSPGIPLAKVSILN